MDCGVERGGKGDNAIETGASPGRWSRPHFDHAQSIVGAIQASISSPVDVTELIEAIYAWGMKREWFKALSHSCSYEAELLARLCRTTASPDRRAAYIPNLK